MKRRSKTNLGKLRKGSVNFQSRNRRRRRLRSRHGPWQSGKSFPIILSRRNKIQALLRMATTAIPRKVVRLRSRPRGTLSRLMRTPMHCPRPRPRPQHLLGRCLVLLPTPKPRDEMSSPCHTHLPPPSLPRRSPSPAPTTLCLRPSAKVRVYQGGNDKLILISLQRERRARQSPRRPRKTTRVRPARLHLAWPNSRSAMCLHPRARAST